MSAPLAPASRWRPSPLPEGLSRWWRFVLVAVAAIGVLFVTSEGQVPLALLAVVAAGLGAVVWRNPYAGLVALVVLGPPHRFLMVVLFHVVPSATFLKAAELWKELVVLTILAKVVHLALQRRGAPRLHPLDLAILIFLALGGLYLIYPSAVPGVTLTTNLYGLRADAFFLVAYFVGRGFPVTTQQVRGLLLGFTVITFIVALVAAFNFVAPSASDSLYARIGGNAFTDASTPGVANTDYIAYRTEASDTATTNIPLPRAPSLFFSALALAFYTLLAGPLALALLSVHRRPRNRVIFDLLTLAAGATALFTVTRSAIIALVPALLVVVWRTRRWRPAALLVAQAVLVALPVAIALHVTPATIQTIFSLSGGSSQGHVRAFFDSLSVLRVDPTGRGLGTSGGTSQVLDVQGGITNEDWYLQLATDMGLVPAALFFLTVLGSGITAFRQYARVDNVWLRALCAGMAGAALGFLLEGFGLHVWDGETTGIIFWLFLGIVVQGPAIEQRQEQAAADDGLVAPAGRRPV